MSESPWRPPIHLLHPDLIDAIDKFAMTRAAEIILAGTCDGFIAQMTGCLYRVKGHNQESTPPNAFIMNLAKTGSGKSPVTQPLISEFEGWEDEHDLGAAEQLLAYNAELDLYKAAVDGIQRAVRKLSASGESISEDLRERRLELERHKPIPPPSCARRLVDLSYRSWIVQAQRNPATFFLIDETSGFFSDLDKPMIAGLCTSWSGAKISYGRGTKAIEGVQAIPTILLNAHPENYMRWSKTSMGRHFFDAGGDARFMHYFVPSYPEMLRRRDGTPDVSALKPIFERAKDLFKQQVVMAHEGRSDPIEIELNGGACDEMRHFENDLVRLRKNAKSAAEAAVIEKASSNVLRHAGRHHAFFEKTGKISAQEIGDSIEWVRWCLDGYFSFSESGQISGRSVENDAEALHQYMRYGTREGYRGKLGKRQLAEEAFNIGFSRASDFNNALSWLCQENLARVKDGVVHWDPPDYYAGKISTRTLNLRR